MLESLREQWDSSAWRWWALGLGALLTALAFGVGTLVDAVRNGSDGQALTGVLLIATLLIASLLGSGMLDSITARTRSSTAAQPRGLKRRLRQASAEEPPPATVEEGRLRRRRRGPLLSDAEQARQDRRTIRCGLVALPLFLALLFLLLT